MAYIISYKLEQKYDTNGDGTVSRFEIEQLVRQRTKDRRDEIERKFQEHLNGEGITEQEIQQAEESKRQHLQVSVSFRGVIERFDLSFFMWSGALERSGVLLSNSFMLLVSPMTHILISTLL